MSDRLEEIKRSHNWAPGDSAWLIAEVERLRAENVEWRVAAAMAVIAFEQLEQWDMLALKPDGHGAATQDAPWARELIARALRALNLEEEHDG